MSNSFGTLFRMTTFGESHSRGVGAIVDGCPPGITLSEEMIQKQLKRRRPGQNDFSTPRNEADTVSILSGMENGLTLGTPLSLIVHNEDHRPTDYQEVATAPRPSHADYTYRAKFGITASSGGGRASARETIGRVCAGSVAEQVLRQWFSLEIVAYVSSVGNIDIDTEDIDMETITRQTVDKSPIRCPNPETSSKMEAYINATRNEKNSCGGIITCACRNVPLGLGNPVFSKLEALLAQAMLSIPAARGFEIGSGFSSARMTGFDHNDLFVPKNGVLGTKTNHSGGIQGGITNGEPIWFRVPFKPVATIGQAQESVSYSGSPVIVKGKGRHDPCVVGRAVPVVESMAACVLLDAVLQQRAIDSDLLPMGLANSL